MDINLKLESNGKKIEVGRGKPFRLLNIEGIESGENELSLSNNVFGDGSKVNNKKIKSKPIMIEAEYTKGNKADERKKLISFFNIHNKGRLKVKIDNTEKMIDYNVESFIAPLTNVNDPLRFLVSLYCPIPFFRDLMETKEQVAVWKPSFKFPLRIKQEGIKMGYREPSLIVNVYNAGNVETGMIIKFRALATLTNPSLFDINTREYFKVNRVMQKGEIITVNTKYLQKRVELENNGVVETLKDWDLSSTFLQLAQGDNLFRYDADEGLDNLEVDIYYSNEFLGV